MFVPGYAVSAGFIEETPNFISVLATAGGQMFFSLSLAMGIMVTYGSYMKKEENIVKNGGVIVFADTLVAILAGLAVIPAAVANGIASGTPVNEIALGGPKLLFVTLQDVFANMGAIGSLFGVIFYLLVIIAAISSMISLIEVISAFFIDKAIEKGKTPNRTRTTLWTCLVITILAVFVAIDGLGASGIFTWPTTAMWNDCLLDFLDCWSEGIAMPLGAMLMALMVGWEIKPKVVLEEISEHSKSKAFIGFFKLCIKFIVPIVMAFILAGQMIDFFKPFEGTSNVELICYIISGVLLVLFWIFAAVGNKKKDA